MDKKEILKKYFGHESFRKGQEEIIDKLLCNNDVLAIMPTGAGKSLCYQIPALIKEGITIVVSPLISLMKDQVNTLVEAGVKAAYINSSLTSSQYFQVLELAKNNAYKIIYVAPERLTVSEFVELCESIRVSMVIVDEAHCVSQWGQDFRPSYLKIVEFVSLLSYRPVVGAFTATATREVRTDIENILCLNNPFVLVTGFDRENLYFEVKRPDDKYSALIRIINSRPKSCGIVYCLTRKSVDEVCAKLIRDGINATRYHAGMSDEERKNSQEDFIYDKKTVMVATNAFGMGIDKSNVSFVVHYNMPKNIESYYQEAGRAGRDGEKADCILLYGGQDVKMNQFLIEKGDLGNSELIDEQREIIKEKDIQRLKMMTFYSTTTDCLRGFMLKYFGEAAPTYCGHCSNCNTLFEDIDVTIESQKIISCVYRLVQRNRSFGKGMIADILHGSNNEKIKRWKMDTLSTYGIMKEESLKRIRLIMDYLIEKEYLNATEGEYSTVIPTEKSALVVYNGEKVIMKLPKVTNEIKADNVNTDYDGALFDILKKLRNKLATAKRLPAYIIFTDAALKDMCRKFPVTYDEFLDVAGVGKSKADKYGQTFCEEISKYKNDI